MFFTKRKSRRQIQNLRKLSRKNVDLGKFVKDFYVEKGLAYISCNVSGYNDIIDRYSVKGYEWVEESFARFVEENAIYIPPEYPLYLVTMFPGIPKVLSEAVFVLFWMALWDSAEFFFVDGRDLQEDKLEAAQLASMAVTFFDKFEDGPAEPEVVQQIMEEMEEEVILPSTQWEQEE